MKYCKFLLCIAALVFLAFQVYAQSDPLSENARGTDQARDEMVGWLNQPVPADVTKSTTTSSAPTAEPTTTTKSTTMTKTSGFEATFGLIGLLAVAS